MSTKNISLASLDALIAAMKQSATPSYAEVEVVREGKQIIIPEGMTHEAAIDWHKRKIAEESREYGFDEVIEAFPLDGAFALSKTLKRMFGFTEMKNSGFFGSNPPELIGVQIGPNETTQVPWGRMEIPNFDGYIETGVAFKDGRWLFRMSGLTLHRHRSVLLEIIAEVRKTVATESIYRAKAIRIKFPAKGSRFSPMDNAPEFLDLTNVRREDLIFPEAVATMVETTLFNPLEFTEQCRIAGIPLKRGILLEGQFGTGKTLTQHVAAKLAQSNGWTVIYIDDVKNLAAAMEFAKQYQPAMILAEDIDRADSDGSRDDTMNTILNTIDGVHMKNAEIMVVLTTNHVESITTAMLRPGRLDAVIPVRPPDAKAVQKLIRLYARGLVTDTEDLSVVGERLAGNIPAVVREVVERAKLAAIGRMARKGQKHFDLVSADLEAATIGMLEHLELLRPKTVDTRSSREKAAEILGTAIVAANNGSQKKVDVRESAEKLLYGRQR